MLTGSSNENSQTIHHRVGGPESFGFTSGRPRGRDQRRYCIRKNPKALGSLSAQSKKPAAKYAAGSTTNPAPTYSPDNPAVTVPSALVGLTAVFGMGTGVTPPPSAPETL